MYLEDLSAPGYVAANPGGNYATNGYPARPPTTLHPTEQTAGNIIAKGDGVIPWGGIKTSGGPGGPGGGVVAPRWLHLVPYGVGAGATTFSLKVLGWNPTQMGVGVPLWVPVTLLGVQCTIGSLTGVANSDLGTTQVFCNTITLTSGFGPSLNTAAAPNTVQPFVTDLFIMSPTGTVDNASLFVRAMGFQYLEVIFTTGGSATSCNALWRKI